MEDKVKAMVSNKLASNMGPRPMDLGMLSGDPKHQPPQQDQQWSDEQWHQYELTQWPHTDDGQQPEEQVGMIGKGLMC